MEGLAVDRGKVMVVVVVYVCGGLSAVFELEDIGRGNDIVRYAW